MVEMSDWSLVALFSCSPGCSYGMQLFAPVVLPPHGQE